MPKDPFNSTKNIAISVKPKTEFSKGLIMRDKKTGKYDSRFKTIDPGKPGGLRLTLGKTKDEVHRESPGGAETETQRYLVEQKDFDIKNKKLIPKTTRGRRELKQIEKRHGELEYIGEEQFIVKKNKALFEEVEYFKPTQRGKNQKSVNKLNEESLQKVRNAGVPESIIRKMKSGRELTEIETEILHKKGLEYVKSFKRKSFVREYTGKTESRMRNLSLANLMKGL